MKNLNYLSLFSGIGAFELALRHTFGNSAHCVGYSEIDKNALKVYQRHFPDHLLLGDVTQITTQNIKKIYQDNHIDLIVGGFPCQNLSNANTKGIRKWVKRKEKWFIL